MTNDVAHDAATSSADQTQDTMPEAAPPAYFLSLSVENVRCFREKQTLDLSDGTGRPTRWTLILGENGIGKTTLLQLLAGMQQVEAIPHGDEATFEPFLFSTRRSFQLFNYQASLFRNTNEDRRLSVGVVLSCGIKLDSHIKGEEVGSSVRLSSPGSGACSLSNEKLRGLICYGYGASRRMGTAALSDKPDEDTIASLFDENAALINAEEWLLQADYAVSRAKAKERKRAEMRRDRVKDILIKLLPDVTDLRIAETSPSSMQARVEMKTPYGWVPMQSLSLGYRTLLTWMVDLAARLFMRYPHSANPLAEPAIVLVDEIDLHLHPRWQRTLLHFLSDTFPNTQFVATAHSPLVVQAATNANIVLLRREGDHVVIENNVEAIKNWRIDQVLTSDLFGLESARPPQLDSALRERERLLSKSRLTKADQARLAQLEREVGDLPTGETAQDMEATDIIRQAAALLSKK